jgi:hypothetical protein
VAARDAFLFEQPLPDITARTSRLHATTFSWLSARGAEIDYPRPWQRSEMRCPERETGGEGPLGTIGEQRWS